MEKEQIVPFEMDCRDWRGRLVHVVGVDQANHRVLFRRPDYPQGLCFCPRRDFGPKFKKVSE